MARNSRTVAGIILFVLSAVAAVAGILNYVARHSRRGLVALIACGILLIVGIVLMVAWGRKSQI
jgi:uncharacterized membrane protein (UPF0136 family)